MGIMVVFEGLVVNSANKVMENLGFFHKKN